MNFSTTNNSFPLSQNLYNDDSFSTPEQSHATQAPAPPHADAPLTPSDSVKAAKNNFSQQIALEDKEKNQQLNAQLVPAANHANEKKSQPDNLPPRLTLATLSNETEKVQSLIKEMNQEQLGIQDNRGNTALTVAIQFTAIGIQKTLINRMTPKQLGIQNKDGKTALILATFREATEIAKTLINKMMPEHLGIQDENGNTALIQAIDIEFFKSALPDINELVLAFYGTQDENEAKALILAEKKERIDMIKLLIQKMKKEHLGIQNKNGETALILAKKVGLTDIEKILNSNINYKNLRPQFSQIREQGLLSFLAAAINWWLNPATWVTWYRLR